MIIYGKKKEKRVSVRVEDFEKKKKKAVLVAERDFFILFLLQIFFFQVTCCEWHITIYALFSHRKAHFGEFFF